MLVLEKMVGFVRQINKLQSGTVLSIEYVNFGKSILIIISTSRERDHINEHFRIKLNPSLASTRKYVILKDEANRRLSL